MRVGEGYLGTSKIETSVAGEELIPDAPVEWTYGYSLNEFSFLNDEACTVRINGKVDLYLRARQGFQMGQKNKPIRSFIIQESGVHYNWIGSY